MSISRIQVAGNAAAATETVNVTVSATTIGDLIIVWGSTGGNSVSTFTISDNAGNTYTPVTGYINVDLSGANHAETDWFGFVKDAFGGVTTVTVTHNAAGASTFASFGVYRSTNGWPANPLDKNPGQGTYGTTATSFSSLSTGTLSQASEVAIGFMQITFDPTSITPGGGFTGRDTSAFLDSREHHFADQIVSATTALTFSATTGSAVDACANVVTFKDNPESGAATVSLSSMNAYVRFRR